MRLSVSGFDCLLTHVFVCMYTQICAYVSAYALGCMHALLSVRNSHSHRKHNSRKNLSSKLFKVGKTKI